MNRARFQPRRPLAHGALIALVVLVAVRLWQGRDDTGHETLDAGEYPVAAVIDGDTIRLANGDRVRFVGIDAPETRHSPRSTGSDQPLAAQARQFVERAVGRRSVRLEFDKERIDRHGRFLAYVWYDGGERGERRLLNEELLLAGLARARLDYHYSEQMKRRFRNAEQTARDARRGLWTERGSP